LNTNSSEGVRKKRNSREKNGFFRYAQHENRSIKKYYGSVYVSSTGNLKKSKKNREIRFFCSFFPEDKPLNKKGVVNNSAYG
jgi:hypothetical protein